MKKLTIEPIQAAIGARVTNISLADVPDSVVVKELDSALEKYGVLVFPGQKITPRQQIDFSAAFGPLELTELEKARLEGFEEIFVVGNVGKGLVSFSPDNEDEELEWHTDHIHHDVAARASLLYAIEAPEQGGDTLFACMYLAYETLSEEQKSEYCKLEAVHSAAGLEHFLEKQNLLNTVSVTDRRQHKEVTRPLIRAHPDTGRKALYFGNQVTIGVVGLSDHDAKEFIANLTEHACQEAFRYRHKWQIGDAVLWDNRRVLHAGTPYDVMNTRRLMHRTTFRETMPITLVDA